MNVWMTMLVDGMLSGVWAYTAPIVACRITREASRRFLLTSQSGVAWSSRSDR
jgi:hypothetical protein